MMRDFKVDNLRVGGDLYVNDNSHQSTLLINCSNDDLLEEHAHRKELLTDERKSKFNRLFIVWIVIILAISISSIWYYFQGKLDIAAYFLSFAGIIATVSTLKIWSEPTEFETRQIEALKEIHLILRERGFKK